MTKININLDKPPTTAELEKMEREAHHNLDFSQISPNKDEIREVKYTRKPSTWDLMKQTADPKELRELQQIEEKHMKKKNNSAYQIAMAAHDEIIKKTMATLKTRPSTSETDIKIPSKIEQENNKSDPDVYRGLGNLINQIDHTQMKPNLISSKDVKFKKF